MGSNKKVSSKGMKQISMLSGKDSKGKSLADGKSSNGSSWDSKGKINNPESTSPIKKRFSTSTPDKHPEIAQPKLSKNNATQVAKGVKILKKIK